MSDSGKGHPVRQRGRRGAVLLAALLAVAPAASGQTARDVGDPIRLIPGAGPGRYAPPPAPATGVDTRRGETVRGDGLPRVRDAAPQPAGRAATGRPPPAADGATVSMRRLGTLDRVSAGSLGPDAGGLPADHWGELPRPALLALLEHLPAATTSPAMQSLTRRLLLSRAELPPAGEARPAVSGDDVLERRAAAAYAAGLVDETAAMVQDRQGPIESPALGRTAFDGLLLAGRVDDACGVAADMVERAGDADWQKAAAFCLARAGDAQRAGLYETLLRDAGVEDDTFYALLERQMGRDAALPKSLPEATPLHLAMLRAVGQPLPADTVRGAGPAVLAALARDGDLDPAMRLDAAERAARVGALAVDDLRAMYVGLAFSPEELQDALVTAQSEPGPRSDALLYQAARGAGDLQLKGQLLGEAMANGRRLGHVWLAGSLFAPLFAELPVTTEMLPVAGDAAVSALAARDVDRAVQWFALAVDAGRVGDADAARLATRIWPLLQVADAEGAVEYDGDVAWRWWQMTDSDGREDRHATAGLLFTLLERFGHEVPERAWVALLDGPLEADRAAGSAALLRELRRGAERGWPGAVAAATLVLLGPGGPKSVEAGDLGFAVGALQATGLGGDARAIALEALLARAL